MSKILKALYVNVTDKNIPILNKEKEIEEQKEIEEIKNHTEGPHVSIEEIQVDLLKNAQMQAERILDKAKKDANTIKDEMSEKMQEETEQALIEAKQRGYDEGHQKGIDSTDNLKIELEQKIKDNELEYIKKVEELEPKIMNFIIDTTKNILTDEFNLNPQLISLIIKKGLISVKEIKHIKIYVSEKNFEYVENNKNDILNVDCEKNDIEIIKDTIFKDEDCIIETEIGSINCSFDMQLNEIIQALHYILKN